MKRKALKLIRGIKTVVEYSKVPKRMYIAMQRIAAETNQEPKRESIH